MVIAVSLVVLAIVAAAALILYVRLLAPVLPALSGREPGWPGVTEDAEDGGAWVTYLCNDGLAPARLEAVRYDLQLSQPGLELPVSGHRVTTVVDALAVIGQRDGSDYLLVGMSVGTALGPGQRRALAVLPMPLARSLTHFSATYVWRGTAGRPIVKTVHFIPPPDRRVLPPPVPAGQVPDSVFTLRRR